MKNNGLVIVLVILIGVLSGVGLLVGINNSVNVSMTPVIAQLNQIEGTQRLILQKIGMSGSGNNEQVLSRLTAIDNKLSSLENRGGGGAPAAPEPPSEDFSKAYDIPVGTSPVDGKKGA